MRFSWDGGCVEDRPKRAIMAVRMVFNSICKDGEALRVSPAAPAHGLFAVVFGAKRRGS